MNSEDQQFRTVLQEQQQRVDGYATDFSAVFEAAERQVAKRRRGRLIGIGAAAAVALLVFNVTQVEEDSHIYVDLDELTATTQWSAPSDSLLPRYETDIYRELPQLLDSTEGVL